MSDNGFAELVAGSGIHYRRTGVLVELLLARVAEGNTLSNKAFAGISAALRRVDHDQDVRGLVIRSAARTFCSGGDYTDPDIPGSASPQYAEKLAECFELWRDRRVPAIAVVNGPARAFGCAIALTCELTIAHRDAYFQLPEMGHGIVPSFAIAALLLRHDTRLVRELALGCAPLTAERAYARGLIAAVANDASAADRLVESYVDIWRASGPGITRQTMRTIADVAQATEEAALRIARAGVADQLARFQANRADQGYLDADRSPS